MKMAFRMLVIQMCVFCENLFVFFNVCSTSKKVFFKSSNGLILTTI